MSSSSYSYNRVGGSVSGRTSMESGSQGILYPRKGNDSKRNQHSSAYVPHNRLSRYTTALINLVPIRFTRIPGSEIPLDKIGLFSSVSFNWLNEYIFAGYKNGARDKTMPILAKLDSCQVNGARIDGLWHNHVVERGQAGASVPTVAWQFVRTRILVASFIYLLGMIISFCNPIIVLRKVISTTQHRLYVEERIKNYTITYENGNITNSLNDTPTTLEPFPAKANLTNVALGSIDGDNLPETLNYLMMIDEVITFSNITALIVAELIAFVLYSWSASMNLRTATRLRSACLALAYKKLVRSSIRYNASAYQTMTYFVPSSKTLYELITNGPLIFSGPLILLLWSLFIWHSMGHWALIGALILVALYACLDITRREMGMYKILWKIIGRDSDLSEEALHTITIKHHLQISSAYLTKIFGTRAMNYSLKRISLMEEYIDNLFLAKVTLWNDYFFRKIQDFRRKELAVNQLGGLSEGWCLSMVHIIPVVTMCAVMMSCILTNQQIVIENYIPCLVLLLVNLKYCVRNSWLAMSSISRGVVSLNKLKSILTLKDADRFTDKPIDKNLAVTINHGHFTWEREKSAYDNVNECDSQPYNLASNENRPVRFANSGPVVSLVDINFYAPKSKLIGICGSCGSGKTSLLLSIMGQLNNVSGRVTIDGTCAYVSQIPWLFEGTLKENILFGENLDSTWYYKTIRSCNLSEDIALLPGSDDTDVTIVNLTLAQKQKIVLARAVYTQRDINLLDNPLSDVEPEESKDIFEKSILRALGEKTVIMISDRVQFLNRCDIIYVMKEGTIVEQGTHEELLQWNSEYTNLLNSYMKKYKKKYYRSGEQINTSMSQLLTTPGPRGILSSTSTTPSFNLDTDEEMISVEINEDSEATMKHTIYDSGLRIGDNFYMRNIGGWCVGIIVVMISGWFAFPVASAPLIFMYIAQRTITDTTHIVAILLSMMGFLLCSAAMLLFIYNKIVFSAARRIHEKWLQDLFGVQMSIFAMISPSIILNVCSLHLQEVDSVLPRLLTTVLMHSGVIIFSVVVLGILSCWLLIPITMFIVASVCYVAYARGLTLSLHETVHTAPVIPIYDHSVNTIAGRAIIQAYHKEREFTKKFYKHCDNKSTLDFMLHAIKLWIEFRIKMLSALTLGVIVLMCAVLSNIRDCYEILGLAFICTLQIALSIVHLTGAFTSAYASLITIATVEDYVENLPKEKKPEGNVPDNWPVEPSIKFENVLLTEKSQEEPINIAIDPGDKVALIGNKPTLKTAFVTSLYKFIEIASGTIYLGDKNISDVPTEKLRKSINFVPADPVLFDGCIRYNLDPNNEKTDKTLMTALQRVHLWEKVSKMTNKLESSASASFKLWEKKLLFLARALLNDSSKIIIIEESADHLGSDDDIVENVLLDTFSDYTVVVLSSRRIRYAKKTYYLEDGKIIEASGRSDLPGASAVDLTLSVPKEPIQTNF